MTAEAGASPKGVEQVIRLRDRDHAAAYKAYADDSRLWGVSVVWPTTDPVKIQAGHHTNKQPCGLDGNTAAKNSEEKGGVYLLEHDYATALAAVCKLNKAAQAAQIDKAYCLARRCDVTADGIIIIDIDGEIPSPVYYGGAGVIERSASSTGLHGMFRATGELREALDALIARGKKNKVKKQIDGSDIEVFYGLGNYVALTGDILSSDGGSDLPRSCKLYTNILRICTDEGAPERQRAESSFTSVDEKPPAAGDAGYQQYEKLISHIGELATQWRPKDGFKQDADASALLWALACYICEQLKALGFPLDRRSAGCVGVIYNIIVPASSVWTTYYAPNAKYGPHDGHYEKLEITIRKAIDETLKGSAGAVAAATCPEAEPAGGAGGSGDKNIVLAVVARAGEYIRMGTGNDGTETFVFDVNGYRAVWNDVTHMCADSTSKDGYLWSDGAEWQQDPHGKVLRDYLGKAADLLAGQYNPVWKTGGGNVSREELRKMIRNSTTLEDICEKRAGGGAINPIAAYGKGLTLRDSVMIIDAQGIRITQHDPEREVWLGAVDAVSTDLIEGLADIPTIEEVMAHFPNALASLHACGEEKARAMATLAGVVIYYTMPQHQPLEYFGYWWDANLGGTGKSTHIKQFTAFFGRYLASGVSWDTFTGQSDENGNFLGKVGVICEEAGVNDVKNVETIKTRTSGGWECRRLYCPRVGIQQPLLMLTLGNTKPLLSGVANKGPIWDRLQPCEFTVKLRDTGTPFPCEAEEYNRFLLNVGAWVAFHLMRVGKAVSKQNLPYHVTPDEVKELCERVPWEDVMTELGMWQAGAETPLKDVYAAVRSQLKKQGWESLAGAPQLKSIESFKRAMDGMRISRGEKRYGVLKVVGVNVAKRDEQGRYMLKNYALNNPQQKEYTDTNEAGLTALDFVAGEKEKEQEPEGRRVVPGSYYVNERTGSVERIDAGDESKGWNVEKFIQQKDPCPHIIHHTAKVGALSIKPAVFVVEGKKLVGIKPKEPAI